MVLARLTVRVEHFLKWGRAICPVVRSYYIWDTGRKKGNWGISWIISFLMKNWEENERTKEFSIFLFSGRWLPEVKTCFLGGIRLVGGFGGSRDLWMSPSRSDLVAQSCYFFFLCSKSRDLGPGHGFRAWSFKNKGKKLDFHILGIKKNKKKEN